MARIPIDIASGKIKETAPYFGIDLGTTNSLIAKIEDGKPVAISDYNKDVIVPSVVHIDQSGALIVGEEAKIFLTEDPKNTIYSVKRLIGQSFKDVKEYSQFFSYELLEDDSNHMVQIKVNHQLYSPIEISAFILSELKKRAEHRLKTEVKQVVITVPAYFNDAQRQATRDAGKYAGLEVVRIINEPTAAALAYGIGLNPKVTQTIAVYDFGGGTFDVTILKVEQGIFDVLSTNGDTFLGGDDMDRVVMEHWLQKACLDISSVISHKAETQSLRLLAEQAKHSLTCTDRFTGAWHSEFYGSHEFQITREEFDTLVLPIVNKTIDCCKSALKDANLSKEAIDEVILVGGSTKNLIVKKALTEFWGKKPLEHLNPDQVVALGAAVQADILAGNRKDLLLIDVTPLSLGIETVGGLMDVLISRNSKIPTRVARQYTTSVDGQTNLKVSVHQGERELVANNRKLAEFVLKGIPPMPAGIPKIEISFLLDADGILQVKAREVRSGVETQIEVKPQYGLTDDQVERMLLDSMQHASEDIQNRMLVETKEQANQIIYFTHKFLNNQSHLLSETELTHIQELIAQLNQSLQTEDRSLIQGQITALEQYTRPFAQRAMDAAIQSAMIGKIIT